MKKILTIAAPLSLLAACSSGGASDDQDPSDPTAPLLLSLNADNFLATNGLDPNDPAVVEFLNNLPGFGASLIGQAVVAEYGQEVLDEDFTGSAELPESGEARYQGGILFSDLDRTRAETLDDLSSFESGARPFGTEAPSFPVFIIGQVGLVVDFDNTDETVTGIATDLFGIGGAIGGTLDINGEFDSATADIDIAVSGEVDQSGTMSTAAGDLSGGFIRNDASGLFVEGDTQFTLNGSTDTQDFKTTILAVDDFTSLDDFVLNSTEFGQLTLDISDFELVSPD